MEALFDTLGTIDNKLKNPHWETLSWLPQEYIGWDCNTGMIAACVIYRKVQIFSDFYATCILSSENEYKWPQVCRNLVLGVANKPTSMLH